MKLKLFKYSLKDTEQFISVPLVYVEQYNGKIAKEFIVTQDLLEEFDMSAEIFLTFLKGELKTSNSNFSNASEMYASNLPFSQTSFIQESIAGRNNIVKIITENGIEHIEPKPQLNPDKYK